MTSLCLPCTLYLGLPPMAAASLAYSDTGRRLPTADTGRLAIWPVLKGKWDCSVTLTHWSLGDFNLILGR